MIAERLLRPSRACVHTVAAVPDPAGLSEHGIASHRLRTDADGLYANVAAALRAPAWFGGNADALADMLRDLSWLPRQGRVLIVPAATTLFGDDPCRAGMLVSCWLDAGERWADDGLPFHLLLVV